MLKLKNTSNLTFKDFFILLIICIVLVFGSIVIEQKGVKFVANSDSISRNSTLHLTLKNNTLWPIRYQSKCKGQIIQVSVQVSNGWKDLSKNDECSQDIMANFPTASFEFLWPFQTKDFSLDLGVEDFEVGNYIFGIWTDTTAFGKKRSIFLTKFSNLVQTNQVDVQ